MSLRSKAIELLRLFTSLLFNSIFLQGYIDGRRVPVLLNASLLAVQVYAARGGLADTLAALATVVATYIVRGSGRAVVYSSTLALIPGLWYLALSLLLTLDPRASALVLLRVFTISLSTLCFIYFVNPLEVSVALRVLGLKRAALFPALTWRIVPHLTRDAETALLVGRLKGVETWRGLAILVLAAEEYSQLYEEGIYSKPEYEPSCEYSVRHTLATSLVLLSLVAFIALGSSLR